MPVLQEFSRFAAEYSIYNSVQRRVAERIASMVKGCPARVVDIGCGPGAVYEQLGHAPEALMALDFSAPMLAEHPDGPGVVKVEGDFNCPETFRRIEAFAPEQVVSASSLQWSTDIAATLQRIAGLECPASIGLFTANTFRTLHATAGIESPIHSRDSILDAASCLAACTVETVQYELTFDHTAAMLRYIKRSGVSGGDSRLSIAQVRRLIAEYPLDCLEFEVVYLSF
jgi:malonyl-CoA O-methyltransferase